MITDFETNKVFLSALLKTNKYASFGKELDRILEKHSIKPEFIENTRDIWCRDYMPIQIGEKEYVQFKYFPDYYVNHKYIKRLTIQEELQYLTPDNIKLIDLIVDGGNIVKSKNKAIMTEKVFKENKNRTRKSVVDMLLKALRIDELYFIPVQPYDLTGHADGMVRFYDENTLLVNKFVQETNSWCKKLEYALNKTRLNIIEFPYIPSDEEIEGEWTAKGCYINYAQIGNLIIFPQFNINEDGNALRRIKELYPEPAYHVEPIDATDVAKEGGVLNCLTWNTHKPIIHNAIDYLIPLYGDENSMLVIHKDDINEINDALCVRLSPKNKEIKTAWSIQKTFKHIEPIDGISTEDIDGARSILTKYYSSEELSDILESLSSPTKNAMIELMEIPPRLKNYRPKN